MGVKAGNASRDRMYRTRSRAPFANVGGNGVLALQIHFWAAPPTSSSCAIASLNSESASQNVFLLFRARCSVQGPLFCPRHPGSAPTWPSLASSAQEQRNPFVQIARGELTPSLATRAAIASFQQCACLCSPTQAPVSICSWLNVICFSGTPRLRIL